MAWTATQTARPAPRLVRVGRPANDNVRGWRLPTPLLLALAGALAVVAVYVW